MANEVSYFNKNCDCGRRIRKTSDRGRCRTWSRGEGGE